MSITLFGTCRISQIRGNNRLNELITYTHSTKEVIQLIRFLTGKLTIPEPYNRLCFRTGILNNQFIGNSLDYYRLFDNTDVFIIEICSSKKYVHGGYYLHHLCVDPRFSGDNVNTPEDVMRDHVVEKQSDEEIETDILEIRDMLAPKKVVIVSHYNAKLHGENIPARNHLIQLLDSICKKHAIPFVNPTDVLVEYSQEQVMSEDLGHYTNLGIKTFTNYMNSGLPKKPSIQRRMVFTR